MGIVLCFLMQNWAGWRRLGGQQVASGRSSELGYENKSGLLGLKLTDWMGRVGSVLEPGKGMVDFW